MERRTRLQNEDTTTTTYAYLSELRPSITNYLNGI
jgi:hypothetical protein